MHAWLAVLVLLAHQGQRSSAFNRQAQHRHNLHTARPEWSDRHYWRRLSTAENEQDPDALNSKAAKLELKRLETAAEANKEEFDALLKAKLDEWMEMKAAGILDKLGMDGASEETVVEMDAMSKRLLRRKRGTKKAAVSGSGAGAEGGPEEGGDVDGANRGVVHADDKAKVVLELTTKLETVGHSKTGTALGVQGLLNEIKDKQVEDTGLVEACLMALTKLGSNSVAVASYKQYQRWVAKGTVDDDAAFSVRFVTALFASDGLAEAGQVVMDLALADHRDIDQLKFLPGLVCRDIYASVPAGGAGAGAGEGAASNSTEAASALQASLHDLYTRMPGLPAARINVVLRALGRRRCVREIFTLIEQMRIRGPAPDDETLEFLASALVASVEEEAKARSMKDLPKPVADLPEVVFAGRSNVGKSSLVNFMVNRKALASTSATPGHTTQFHFFNVNAGRKDLPTFRLVDVPGLGYAEAEENTQVCRAQKPPRLLFTIKSITYPIHFLTTNRTRGGRCLKDTCLCEIAWALCSTWSTRGISSPPWTSR